MRARCAGRSTTPRSNPPASSPGGATPITSRRRSFSPACRRATASPRRWSCDPAGTASTTSSPGADNFFQSPTRRRRNRERLVDKLGERYEIAQTDIKKWTVGSPIQGPLDAIEAIRGKRPFEADQVQRVTVRLAPSVAAVVDNRDIPDICLQHMVAVMLLDKTASLHAAHDKPRMQEPAALRQRAKVDLVRDEELAKLLPVRVAIVEIELDRRHPARPNASPPCAGRRATRCRARR